MPTIPPGTTVADMSEQARAISGQNKPPTPSIWRRIGQALVNIVDPTGPQPETVADDRLPAAGESAIGNRDFGPLKPLSPRTDADSPEQVQGARQFQYPFGANIIVMPRAEQPTLLTPFEQLRNLAALYDVSAMCIGARIEETQGLDWAVMAKNKRDQPARQTDCDEATAFFKSPDRVNDFQSWLGLLLYDLFSIDAMTLYRRPDLAGRLYSLDPVDGSTIKPLLDDRGRTLAYQQVLYGYPFSDYKRPSADAPDERFPTYSTNQLIYKPRWVRTFTPYGFPPTEWVILRVNTALRKQAFDMSYFTEGNIPDMIATPPEGTLNPEQVQQFEEHFNAMLEGKDGARRKVRFFAWNMNIREMQKFEYNTILDDWMMRITCAAYGVPPNELGFTESVNRATAEIQSAVNDRRGLKPLTKWLASAILEPAIYDYGGKLPAISVPGRPTLPARNRFEGLHWQWKFGDEDDQQAVSQIHIADIQAGVITPQESRDMRYGGVLDGPAPGKPAADLSALMGANAGLPTNADNRTPAPDQAPVTKADVGAIVKEELGKLAASAAPAPKLSIERVDDTLFKLVGPDGHEYHRGSYRACDGKRAKLKKEARAGDAATPFPSGADHAVAGDHATADTWATYG